MDLSIGRRGVAEFIGTFTLVFIGGGAGIVSSDLVGVALANGLAIGLMVSNFGHISGGHFNPAITLGFVTTRRIKLRLAVAYWIVQFGAAAVAALLLRWIFKLPAMLGSVPHLSPHINVGQGLVVEMILTFFLVIAVFSNAVDPGGAFKAIAGLGIGLTITIDVLMGGPLTGAAMNPARAFGPELVSNFWGAAWIYYVGPAAGAVIAAVGYDYLYLRPPRPSVVGTPESGVDEPRPGDAATS